MAPPRARRHGRILIARGQREIYSQPNPDGVHNMHLPVQAHGNVLVARVVGRLDQDSIDAFLAALAPNLASHATAGHGLVLDLSELAYVSSAGLRCFMLAAKEGKARHGRVGVAALQPLVAEVFQISRFNLVLEVFPSVETAVAALAA